MPESKQEQEFRVFGITGKLRAGLLLGFLGLSISANVTLFYSLQRSKDDNIKIQQAATKQVIELLRPQVNNIQNSVNSINEKVDTAARAIQQVTDKIKQP